MIKFTKKQKDGLSALKKYAESHIVSSDDISDMMIGNLPPIGDTPEHNIMLSKGYRVVFSLEEQPVGVVKHISFSRSKNKIDLDDLNIILKEFGMQSLFLKNNNQYTWIENGLAYNVLELS